MRSHQTFVMAMCAAAVLIPQTLPAQSDSTPRFQFGGYWYAGVGGRPTTPTGDFQSLGYNTGVSGHAPFGLRRANTLLGARVDLNYNRFNGRRFVGSGLAGNRTVFSSTNPQVLSATLNLTAQMPLRFAHDLSVYGMGGGGLYHFRSLDRASGLGGATLESLGDGGLAAGTQPRSTRNRFGAQLGAGMDWRLGRSAVYVESRWVNVFADRDDRLELLDYFGGARADRLRWVPVVLGVKIR